MSGKRSAKEMVPYKKKNAFQDDYLSARQLRSMDNSILDYDSGVSLDQFNDLDHDKNH